MKNVKLFRMLLSLLVLVTLLTGNSQAATTIDRVTYASDEVKVLIDVFATALPGNILTISGDVLMPKVLTEDSKNPGKFYVNIPVSVANGLPTNVIITNTADTPTIQYPVIPVDEVTISQAIYDPVNKELTIMADSRDKLNFPSLTVTVFDEDFIIDYDYDGEVYQGTMELNGNSIPPKTVQVFSASGGSATAFVSIVTSPTAPLANDDTANVATGVTIVINVLENDSATAPLSLDPSSLYVYNVSSGATVNSNGDGTVSFTAELPGTYYFNYTVNDNDISPSQSTALVTVTVSAPSPIINTTALASGVVGTSYSHTFTATGIGPYTWSYLTGTLPAGLNFSPTGDLSGIPTAAGTFGFSLQVTDNQTPPKFGVQAFTLVVTVPLPVSGPFTIIRTGVNQVTLSASATEGTGNFEFQFLKKNPDGSYTPVSGAFGPASTWVWNTTTATPGSYVFAAYVRNAGSSAAFEVRTFKGYTLLLPPSVSTVTLANGLVGTAYNQALSVTGGSAPYTWSLANATTLPSGLFLSAAGAITGTPTAASTTNFDVTVSDSFGATSTSTLSINVIPKAASATLTINTTGLNQVTLSATATGGSGNYEYQFLKKNPDGSYTPVSGAYGPTSTWVWDTTLEAPGLHVFSAYVRNAGTTVLYDIRVFKGYHYTLTEYP